MKRAYKCILMMLFVASVGKTSKHMQTRQQEVYTNIDHLEAYTHESEPLVQNR